VADEPIPLNYRTPRRRRQFVLHWGSVVLLTLLIVSSVAAWLERRHAAKEAERWNGEPVQFIAEDQQAAQK
jgi:hypothetical protein